MKTLYLLKMGCDDNNITTDIKNHRVRVVENIDICYEGKTYNMFFEFCQGAHRRYRKTNKRTGAPLKREVVEIIVKDGLYIDTQFEKLERVAEDGTPVYTSWRHSVLENEFYNEDHAYTREDILEVVNRYKIGEKYTDICLIDRVDDIKGVRV